MILSLPANCYLILVWEIIYEAININSKSIILSHLSLESFFDFDDNNISINIKKNKKRFFKRTLKRR